LRFGQCGQPVFKCGARRFKIGTGCGIFGDQAGDFSILGRQRRACGDKIG